MKTSFKTTTLIAAIGIIVYTTYVLTRYVLSEYFGIHYVFDLATEIRIRLIYDILPLSFIIAGVGLLKYRPSDAASKSFQVFTKCLFVALVGTLLFSPLRVTLVLAICLLTIPMILEALSGISCMLYGYVLCFDSSTIKAWIRWIAPTLVFVHFVFPQIKAINATRNSHCTPDSFDESTFHRNRATTLIMIGVAITALLVIYLCKPMLRGACFFHYNVLHDLEWNYVRALTLFDEVIPCISGCVFGVSGIISWIMLSIMAFRQLPNSRGYKIYNIICQIATWGSILPAIFAPSNFDEIFEVLFLISFSAFFVTTTIRVISYSLPK